MAIATPSLLGRLRAALREPAVAGVDLDSDDCLAVHRALLGRKPLLRSVMVDFYRACIAIDARWFTAAGARVEIGAGVSFLGELFPAVLCSDVRFAPHLDLCLDALRLPFRDRTLRAVFGINCFHHLREPTAFFAELERTLAPGGGCVLIDPYYGPAARVLYARLHDSEGFDPTQEGWDRPEGAQGAMTGANQALSYIVFARDRARFEREFPALRLVEQRPLDGYLRYVLSGGLNFHALAPSGAAPLVRGLEAGLGPVRRLLGLHHAVVLRREDA